VVSRSCALEVEKWLFCADNLFKAKDYKEAFLPKFFGSKEKAKRYLSIRNDRVYLARPDKYGQLNYRSFIDFQEKVRAQEYLENKRETLRDTPVFNEMRIVSFNSYSQGRRRKRRKDPRVVILIQYPKGSGPYRVWSGRVGDGNGYPWDEWAMEIFNNDFHDSLDRPDEQLQEYLLELLEFF